MRERESLFNEYLIEVRKREKEEKNQRREMVSATCLVEHTDFNVYETSDAGPFGTLVLPVAFH